MNDLAHAILSLSNCVASNVEQFEKTIETIHNRTFTESEKIDTRNYIVSTTEISRDEIVRK
jgi:hypothetical protein